MSMHALVVGNRIYDAKSDFDELPLVANDAKTVHELLTNSPTSLFSPQTSTCATDVTISQFEEIVGTFFSNINRPDFMLFYFAGHARKSPNGKRLFLIMRNTVPSSLAHSAFDVDRIVSFLDEKQLNRYIVILDCCYAQGALKSPGVRSRGTTQVPLPEWAGHGKVFIAATGEYQLAHELDELEHGLFTYYLIQGIETGLASPDKGKEWINALDICTYIRKQILDRHPMINQEPIVSSEDMSGDLVIAKNPRFQPDHLFQEELVESRKKYLSLSDLSDKEKVQAAMTLKLREFIAQLREMAGTRIEAFRSIVLKYSEAVGLRAEIAELEFETNIAKEVFSAVPKQIPAELLLRGRFAKHGRAVMVSAAAGTYAIESQEFESSLFSYYFRDGLSGAAADKDGLVTLESSFDYVQERVRGYEHFSQRPVLHMIDFDGQGPILTGKRPFREGKRIALLIATDRFVSPHVTSLKYAERDVSAVAKILSELGEFECRVLVGSKASSQSVWEELDGIVHDLSSDDLFMLYFSGHSTVVRDAVELVLYDSDLKRSQGTLSLNRVAETLRSPKVGIAVVVLDASMRSEDFALFQ